MGYDKELISEGYVRELSINLKISEQMFEIMTAVLGLV